MNGTGISLDAFLLRTCCSPTFRGIVTTFWLPCLGGNRVDHLRGFPFCIESVCLDFLALWLAFEHNSHEPLLHICQCVNFFLQCSEVVPNVNILGIKQRVST